MKSRLGAATGAIIATILMLSCSYEASALAVMSVDIGSEWLKIGIVSVS